MVKLFTRRKKGIEDEEETFDAIKQIEVQVEKLEKQWEEMEKKFKLKHIDWTYRPDPATRIDGDAHFAGSSLRYYCPNKHFKKLWKEFVKLQKRILALEHYIRLLEEMGKSARTRHAQQVIRKLRRIIGYAERDVITRLNKELIDFRKAINDSRKKEEKYMHDLYIDKHPGLGLTWEEANEKTRRVMRRLFDPVFKSEDFGYDFERRMEFFDHLEHELGRLRGRLEALK